MKAGRMEPNPVHTPQRSVGELKTDYYRMKKWIFATILAGLSFVSNAQYQGDRSFRPHFYAGANAGVNSYWGEDYKTYMLEHADKTVELIGRVALGYDFTPVLGLRGFVGYTTHNWPNTNNNYAVQSFNSMNFTLDLTLDITNMVGGYDYNQAFNLVVFGGAGAGNQFTSKLPTYIVRGGLQGNFHLSKYLDLNLIGENNIVRDEYNDGRNTDTPIDVYPAITIGLTYHIKTEKHKTYKKKTWNPRSPKWGE